MPKQEFVCFQCGLVVSKYASLVRGKRFYCSVDCRNIDYSTRFDGRENPNFGNKWTDSRKAQHSENTRKRFENNESLRYQAGKANRGKKLDKSICQKMSASRYGKKGKPHSEEVKKKIGDKSKAKWTDEYKRRNRITREKLGLVIPIEDKTDYEIYYQQSNWIARMFDIVDVSKLKTFGVWSAKNRNGLVRDHIYSRRSGFTNGVFPEIMRHPANCQLLTQSENIAKGRRGNISLSDLFLRISQYEYAWPENDICKKLIEEYNKGHRWDRNVNVLHKR